MVQTTASAWSLGVPDDDEPTAYDQAVEAWNRLFPDERAEAITQCRREGHLPRLAVGFAWVCPRCLHYAPS